MPQQDAASPLSAAGAQSMQIYSPKDPPVDVSTLQPLGAPSDLGGEVVSGDPKLFGRIDFKKGHLTGGLFMATTGTVRITFPFTEHATILEGEVTLTDEAGQTRSMKAGDSYLIRQNQVILWDVKGKHVIKSFFNIVEQTP
jgi:hypothetical protein